MRITASIMLGGFFSYMLYVWEHGSTVYHTRNQEEVHVGKTSFYVLIPNDRRESDTAEELKEIIRTHGEEIARMFVQDNPGKVGQLLVHLDKEGSVIRTMGRAYLAGMSREYTIDHWIGG